MLCVLGCHSSQNPPPLLDRILCEWRRKGAQWQMGAGLQRWRSFLECPSGGGFSRGNSGEVSPGRGRQSTLSCHLQKLRGEGCDPLGQAESKDLCSSLSTAVGPLGPSGR